MSVLPERGEPFAVRAWFDELAFCLMLQRDQLWAPAWSHSPTTLCSRGHMISDKSFWGSQNIASVCPITWTRIGRTMQRRRTLSLVPFRREPSLYVGLGQRRAFCIDALCSFQVLRPDLGELAGGVLMQLRVNGLALVFAYCPDIILWDDGSARVACYIVITEYLVVALPQFLVSARDGAVGVAWIDT